MTGSSWIVALAAGALAAGCATEILDVGDAGAGGSTTITTTTTTTITTATATTITTATDTSSSCTAACCPKAPCTAFDKECIGLVDNAGQTKFGLRMSELDITAPAALSGGLVGQLLAVAIRPKAQACYLDGAGTFSWLIQFDLAAGKIKTGGAKPVADANQGYSFINEVIQGIQVSPVELDGKPDAVGAFSAPTGVDLVMPIYIDAMNVVLLPIKAARFAAGTLSASHNCIGHFNAEGLDPLDACLSSPQHPSFITGATLDGAIVLEDADKIIVSAAQVSLCFLLAGNDPQYGQTSGGITVCKRDASGKIVFHGDACSVGTGCGDAMSLKAGFAASSVEINN